MTVASDVKPVRRIVKGRDGALYVAEVFAEWVTIRPKGSRSSKVRVSLRWGSIFQRGLIERIEEEQRAKRAARRARKGARR